MGRKVLIAEDEALVALDLSTQLQALGYTIVGSAASGEETIRIAVEQCPDIILMDVRLRGRISGLQAAAEIQKKNEVALIFVTASSDKKTLKRLEDFNASVLKKPFTRDQLRDILEAVA